MLQRIQRTSPKRESAELLGQLREEWTLQWSPATDISLIEKSILGNTLEDICTRFYRERLNEANEEAVPLDVVGESRDRLESASSAVVTEAEPGARAESARRGRLDESDVAKQAVDAGRYSEAIPDAAVGSTEEHVFHSLAVPGLEVLGVSLEDAGALSGLKILHLLPSGDTLDILYVGLFSEAADPRGAGLDESVETESFPTLSAQLREAALPPGWRQVVVRKENRWVVARAPISEGELRAYLMTLN